MTNDNRAINEGDLVLARVAAKNIKHRTAWRYAIYQANRKAKTGYTFVQYSSRTLLLNPFDCEWSIQFESVSIYPVVHGRPVAGANAPQIAQ